MSLISLLNAFEAIARKGVPSIGKGTVKQLNKMDKVYPRIFFEIPILVRFNSDKNIIKSTEYKFNIEVIEEGILDDPERFNKLNSCLELLKGYQNTLINELLNKTSTFESIVFESPVQVDLELDNSHIGWKSQVTITELSFNTCCNLFTND